MTASFPTVQAIEAIEVRQGEALRQLVELEERIDAVLRQFGGTPKPETTDVAADEPAVLPMPCDSRMPGRSSLPAVKVA